MARLPLLLLTPFARALPAFQVLTGLDAARLQLPNASAWPVHAEATLRTDGSAELTWGQEAGSTWTPAVSARQQLRLENEALRGANERLRASTAALRAGNTELQHQDAKLRREDTELRLEDAALRDAWERRADDAAELFNFRAQAKWDKKVKIAMGIALGVGACILCCILHCSYRYLSDDDADGEVEDMILGDLDDHKSRTSCCPCCWCCCTNGVLTFLSVVIVISILTGAFLWEMGTLQPVLSPFMTYIYVIGVFAAFVAILFWEFWQTFRKLVEILVKQFKVLKRVMRPFKRVPKSSDTSAV